MRTFLFFLTLLSAAACRKEFEAPVPDLQWELFQNPAASPLPRTVARGMEGVYTLEAGAETFGPSMVLKSSYVVAGTDTTYRVALLGDKDIPWILFEGRRLGDSILLNGYWRKLVSTETGKAQLVIPAAAGATLLLQNPAAVGPGLVTIRGVFGNGSAQPDRPVSLRYQRALYNASPYEVIAHRAGGRTSDLLPHSENSINMIRFASWTGATGIEIDTRLTKDGVPILYHDETLNLRLIQKNGLVGPIKDYTYEQLERQVRLIDGQRIPTLRQALRTVVDETDLRFVWLDTKFEGPMDSVRALQFEFRQRAALAGRQLEILIGLPTDETYDRFRQLPNFTSIPSLCELSTDKTAAINARVWAPRWTLGLQPAEVAAMKAQGRRVFVWTLDVPEYIRQFQTDGDFDGILSNYPSLVAYYHYARQ